MNDKPQPQPLSPIARALLSVYADMLPAIAAQAPSTEAKLCVDITKAQVDHWLAEDSQQRAEVN